LRASLVFWSKTPLLGALDQGQRDSGLALVRDAIGEPL
jgi:hypothetical protein